MNGVGLRSRTVFLSHDVDVVEVVEEVRLIESRLMFSDAVM